MRPDLNQILGATSQVTDIDIDLIRSKRRRDPIMMARHCFSYLAVIKYHYKRTEVARFLGKKYHCATCHSVSVIVSQMSINKNLSTLVDQIHKTIETKNTVQI